MDVKNIHTQSTVLNDKILIVEDDEISQLAIQTLLMGCGYQTDIAKNGGEALQMLQKSHYQIIFMDIGLPDISGFEVTSKIRATEKPLSSIPIIALTAHTQQTVGKQFLQSGMNAMTTKPMTQEKLSALLLAYL